MVSGIFTPLKVALNLKSLIKRFINQGRYVKTGQRNNGAAVYRNTNSDARVLYRNGDGTWAANNRVAELGLQAPLLETNNHRLATQAHSLHWLL